MEERAVLRADIFEKLDLDDYDLEEEEGGVIYYLLNFFSFHQEVQYDTPYQRMTQEERAVLRADIFERLDIDDYEFEEEPNNLASMELSLPSEETKLFTPTQLSSNVGKGIESRGDNAVYATEYTLLRFLHAVSMVLYL